MKLVTFTYNQRTNVGAIIDNMIVDGSDDIDIPDRMIDFLNNGAHAFKAMQKLIKKGSNRIPLAEVKILPPIPRPGKFLAISLNYADHISETHSEKPEYPTFFSKQNNCIIADGEAIKRPLVSEKLDYEGELAFIIGKRCKHVPKEKAANVIAGFTIVNDVSIRDWQKRSPTMMLGKSFDTHGPMGPCLVTSDEIDDPHKLNINTWVDNDLRQSSNTKNMIFNCYEMVEYLSKAMTLEPGDVISTGTPAGVGVKMQPRGYMKPGQTVKVEIENIGILTNPVIQEIEESLF